MNESNYSRDRNTEEDKDFFEKYSPSGESEWTRGSVTPFDDDIVLSERHYHLGHTNYGVGSQFSQKIEKDYTGVGPLNYRRSDERVHDDVSDALYRCVELDASDIEVDVKDGIVTLIGTVENRLAKKIAEMTIEPLPGVMDINNLLVIEKPRGKGLMMHHSPVP